jgi:outer membrane protein assembly factor BamB
MIRSCLVLACLAVSWPLAAAEPIQYFRADGGVAQGDQPLPDKLDAPGALKWKVPLTAGHSTPCVSGDAIYVTTYDKNNEQLATVALDRVSGKIRWTQPVPAKQIELFHPTGSPAAPAAPRRQTVFASSAVTASFAMTWRASSCGKAHGSVPG